MSRAVVILAAMAVVGFGSYRLFPGFWEDIPGLTFFYLVWSALLWAYIAAWVWRKRRAGAVVLDLGRSKTLKTNLVLGGLIVGLHLFVLVGDLLWKEGPLGVEEVSRYFCLISSGVSMLLLGLSHSEIREEGISYCGLILPWKKCESYQWEGQDQGTLTIWVKRGLLNPFLPSWRFSLGIPSGHKDTVHSLVAEHISGAKKEL